MWSKFNAKQLVPGLEEEGELQETVKRGRAAREKEQKGKVKGQRGGTGKGGKKDDRRGKGTIRKAAEHSEGATENEELGTARRWEGMLSQETPQKFAKAFYLAPTILQGWRCQISPDWAVIGTRS